MHPPCLDPCRWVDFGLRALSLTLRLPEEGEGSLPEMVDFYYR